MNSLLFNIQVALPTLGKAVSWHSSNEIFLYRWNSGKNWAHSGYRYYISTADISVLVLHPTSVQIGLVVFVN